LAVEPLIDLLEMVASEQAMTSIRGETTVIAVKITAYRVEMTVAALTMIVVPAEMIATAAQ